MNDNKIALLGIIVEAQDSISRLNAILHDYRDFITGRMGIPYHDRGVNVISLILEAPAAKIDELAAQVSGLAGVSAQVVCARQ